jgi:hypothetical protein
MKDAAMGDEHVVEISHKKGKFKYRLNDGAKQEFLTFRVSPGDRITWVCQNPTDHFAIDCGYVSPFPTRHFRGHQAQERTGNSVPANALPGRYKYTVAVWDGQELWMDDPEFIIRG